MQLPNYFKPLFWDIHFDSIDSQKNRRLIITRTINYGNLKHWKYLSELYGRSLENYFQNIPKSEFRQPALKLAQLIYNLDEFKYASRSDYIQSQKIN